jgi:outer membrane receptor protein involved in Fe transport
MKPVFKVLPLSALIASASLTAAENNIDLPDLVVSADFRPTLASETAVSLTAVDEETISARNAQHIEEILNLVPNVNVSSGGSRANYFQIRGMGETSQFQAPINPSVGLIVDGIDFSRTGSAATLFDVESVQVLRGPQGTKFGTNALAGTILLRSKEPTAETSIHAEAGVAEYGTYNAGIAVGGTLIEDKVLGRASIFSHQSDGYMDNDFLNRDDTMQQDEITARGKLKFLVSDDFTIDVSYVHLDIDNGYDAFTLDNSRTSQSNEPGQDKNLSNGVALKTDWQAANGVTVQTETSYLQSDVVYSFDYDWTNANFNSIFERDRENTSFDIRALSGVNNRIFNDSTDWTIGFFYYDQDEAIDIDDDFGDTFTGDYDTKNTALYGQLDTQLTEKLTLVTGLRVEKFKADYKDTRAVNADTDENLLGGKIGLNYQVNDDHLAFTSLSRGYKSGGINNDNSVTLTDSERRFDTEYNYTVETGLKSFWLDKRMVTDITLFYTQRRDAQINNSLQLSGGGFAILTSNAADAVHQGLEASMNWLVTDKFRVLASLGYLDARFDDYNTASVSLGDRQVAHAPNYTFSVGTEVYPSVNWTVRANIEGKDEFYFSDSHNEQSSSYAIVNASADYSVKNWTVSIWARNLFDRDYYTRGFFFDNTPPTYTDPEKYVQYAEPRVAGITVKYDY